MQGQQVVLKDGKVVNVFHGSGIKEVDAFHKGEAIKVKKRTTTIKITEGTGDDEHVLAETTVSCSHLDDFTKIEGRKEAWRNLLETPAATTEGGILVDRENRVRVVAILSLSEEKPKLKDKAAKKAKKKKAEAE